MTHASVKETTSGIHTPVMPAASLPDEARFNPRVNRALPTDTSERVFIINPNASLTVLEYIRDEVQEKLRTLIEVSLCEQFSECAKETIHNYHSLMSDAMHAFSQLQAAIHSKAQEETLAQLLEGAESEIRRKQNQAIHQTMRV